MEILKKIGLSPVEIKVYLILLKVGSSLAGTIAKRAEVNRSNCYDALKRLIEKGLVSYVVKANRKYFQANAPESLLTLIKDKKAKLEAELEQEKIAIKQIIPKLKEKAKLEEQEASIYETKKGIKSLLDDMLKTKKEIFILGVAGEISEILTYYLPRFHKQRIKLKIPFKIILSEKLRKTRGKELKQMKHTKVKFLSEEYCSISTTNIYDNKISIMLWSEKPLGILVKNKVVADSHKKQFELLWKIAKN